MQRYVESRDAAAAAIDEPTWAKVKPVFLTLLAEHEAEAAAARKDMKVHYRTLSEWREGLEWRAQDYQKKIASLNNSQGKVEHVLRTRFQNERLPDSASLPTLGEEAEQNAHSLFHEQAKVYMKQFPGKTGSVDAHHQIKFADGKIMRLDMDVPAHVWYKTLLEFEKWASFRCTYGNIDRLFYNKYSDFLWDEMDYEDATHFNHVIRLRMFLNESASLGFTVTPFFDTRASRYLCKPSQFMPL